MEFSPSFNFQDTNISKDSKAFLLNYLVTRRPIETDHGSLTFNARL